MVVLEGRPEVIYPKLREAKGTRDLIRDDPSYTSYTTRLLTVLPSYGIEEGWQRYFRRQPTVI